MTPPRYLGTALDRDAFLRELALFLFEAYGRQIAHDLEMLSVDLARHDERRDQDLSDLRRANEELEDLILKLTT